MSWSTSLLRMKPPCVVKPLHLCSPKAPRSRKRRRDSCFHNLNGYSREYAMVEKENLGCRSSRSSRSAGSWRRVALPCLLAIMLRLILIGYTPTEGFGDLSVCGDPCGYHASALRL